MQNQDEINEAQTPAANTNRTQSRKWERRIAIVGIAVASIGLLVCAGLLIQVYIIHKPAFELFGYGSFKPGFELLGYSALVFLFAGYLALLVASYIAKFVGTQQKRLGYVLAFIGTTLIFLSLVLFLSSYKSRLEWQGYFYTVTAGACLIAEKSLQLLGTKPWPLRKTLNLIGYVLLLAGFVGILNA